MWYLRLDSLIGRFTAPVSSILICKVVNVVFLYKAEITISKIADKASNYEGHLTVYYTRNYQGIQPKNVASNLLIV